MSSTPPRHPALAAAWRRYHPLRSYLDENGIPVEEVVGGTQFTVGHPQVVAEAMHKAVSAGPQPQVTDLTFCDGGTPSPCRGGGERACGDINPFFSEFHAKVMLPNYLQGVAPYTRWGGGMLFEDGAPKLQRQEEVCAAITIPQTAPPESGWPVVLFAHDTGQHFRSFIVEEVAARLARKGWAVVSFDGVLQGARSGDAPLDAAGVVGRLEDLENVSLQRDQGLQALADLFSMTRALSDTRVTTDLGNAGFDLEQSVFFGHGYGAHPGLAYIAYEPIGLGAVFSAPAAGMVDLLRLSRQPTNLSAELEIAFADPDLNGMHPGLHLAQAWLDPRDPVNFGRYVRRPPEGVRARHILMLYGAEDTITPPGPVGAFAVAARLERVGEELVPIDAVREVESGGPAQGNVRTTDGPRTQVVKQYAPDGDYDGHEVVFRHQEAIGDLNSFFGDLAQDPESAPTIRD